jgi:hypothetical protein
MRKPELAIIPLPRRAPIAPVSIRFFIGAATPERAAAMARQIGLIRAELKLHRLVFVKPHVRTWPRRAN